MAFDIDYYALFFAMLVITLDWCRIFTRIDGVNRNICSTVNAGLLTVFFGLYNDGVVMQRKKCKSGVLQGFCNWVSNNPMVSEIRGTHQQIKVS